MASKKTPCQNWRLYVITDAEGAPARPLEDTVRLAIEGGADVIQLRDKKASDQELTALARRLHAVTRGAGVALIINDRARVAKDSGAEGLHLGQDDGPLKAARELLGPAVILGRSTHSPEQALDAQNEGFDYIGVGPVFATPTKPGVKPVGLELVRFARQSLKVPFVAIGGIDASNATAVRGAGASAIAVVRAVMAASDPRRAAEQLV